MPKLMSSRDCVPISYIYGDTVSRGAKFFRSKKGTAHPLKQKFRELLSETLPFHQYSALSSLLLKQLN